MSYYCGDCRRTVWTSCSHARARRNRLTSGGSSYSRGSSDVGSVGIDSSGHLTVGLGGGLGIDTVNGDLTVFGIDTGI